MKSRTIHLLLIGLLVLGLARTSAYGCVGRILYVGTLDTVEDKVLAELLVLLINERTGTTVKIRYFDDTRGMYRALRAESEDQRVDVIVEDTDDALALLKKDHPGDRDTVYRQVKELYENELGLVWLDPFGFDNGPDSGRPTVSAPLVRKDVLANYPLLPRVLNKLAGAINTESLAGLTEQVRSGAKPRNVSRDFLRDRKLI